MVIELSTRKDLIKSVIKTSQQLSTTVALTMTYYIYLCSWYCKWMGHKELQKCLTRNTCCPLFGRTQETDQLIKRQKYRSNEENQNLTGCFQNFPLTFTNKFIRNYNINFFLIAHRKPRLSKWREKNILISEVTKDIQDESQ